MTIDKGTRAEILRLYHAEKWKIGTIADQLGVHHSTVDRVLADAGVPRQDRRRRRSKLDPFLPFIRQTLEVYPNLPASRLHEMVRERGYAMFATASSPPAPGAISTTSTPRPRTGATASPPTAPGPKTGPSPCARPSSGSAARSSRCPAIPSRPTTGSRSPSARPPTPGSI